MSTKANQPRVGTVSTFGDTNTLPKQMVTYLNVDIVYQKVYHLED